MKISIDTDYSLRALQELAIKGNNEPYSVYKIAQARSIPNKYLEKLFRKLKNAGILKATKGRKGGYVMACEPEKITVKDIIGAVDGRTHIHSCEERKSQKLCEFIDQCTFQDFWNDFNSHIDNFLETYTLADFLKKQK